MINLSGVTKRYGDRVLYENASFLVRDGDKIGLVGPNGAGKSTIFRIITGRDHVDGGSVSIEASRVVGYFDQNVGEMRGHSALAECITGVARVSEIAGVLAKMEERLSLLGEQPMEDAELEKFMEKFGELQHEFQVSGGYDIESRAQTILTGLGIGPDRYNDPVESFSGGWKMRIALAKILLLNPDALLMDEPTNHLDMSSQQVLLQALKQYDGTIVFVSHDRFFIDQLATRIIEIKDRKTTSYLGNYEAYLQKKISLGLLEGETGVRFTTEAGRLADDTSKPKNAASSATTANKEPSGPREQRQQQYFENQQQRREFERKRRSVTDEIASLESALARNEERLAVLEVTMSDAGFYEDYERSAPIIEEYDQLKEKIAQAYVLWEKLQGTLEELDNSAML
jgi:ATPase subunit of ABC transporter with duplicated ATPase domains